MLVNSATLRVEGEADCELGTAEAQDPVSVRMRRCTHLRVEAGGLHQYLSAVCFGAWSFTELRAC